MIKTFLFLLFILIIIALILGISPLTRLKRKRIANRAFPSHWTVILERNIALYKHLPYFLHQRLHGQLNVFLAEKKFKGCGGLQLTDEITVTIAGIASLLLLNERGNYFSKLKLILVYPSAFIANNTTVFGEYYLEEKQIKAGESWGTGIVVLSWENIRYDARHWQDGRNVILHEFAHQLDQEAGNASGVPILEKKSDYVTWAKVFRTEYEQLCREVELGKETVIDEYGATDPGEFFAVATETFFEKPFLMKKKHPELYNELKHYYNLDLVELIKKPV